MKLTLRKIQIKDIENMVDYFVLADIEFLNEMGANKSKLPQGAEWIKKLEFQLKKSCKTKEIYYFTWLLNRQEIGHSNINNIDFGKLATIHLHL